MKVPSTPLNLLQRLLTHTASTSAALGRAALGASRAYIKPVLQGQLRGRDGAIARVGALGLTILAPLAALNGIAWAQTAVAATPVNNDTVTPLQAIILGLVQGLTEFIPVSSSAHLNITHGLMGHGRELNFDVMLSIGTTLALGYFFRKEWKGLLTDKSQAQLRNLVFLACIPAVLLGVVIHPYESVPPLSLPEFNAVMLIVAGFIMWVADKKGAQIREVKDVTLKDAILVGIAQALALVPGVSRSGSTITMGRILGFKREDAAKFSFLMSLPISIGAIVYEAFKVVKNGADYAGSGALAITLGVLSAAVSGFWAIGFLLNFLKTRDVTPFFIWRVVVGIAVFAYFRDY